MITRQDIYDLSSVQDLMTLWNEYCNENSMWDDIIDHNDEDFLSNYTPLEIAQKVSFGDYNYHDDFITLDGGGNFKTLNFWSEILDYIDLDAMIDWINDNDLELEDIL